MAEAIFMAGFAIAALLFGAGGFFAWMTGENLPQQIYGGVMLAASGAFASCAFLCELTRIGKAKSRSEDTEMVMQMRALCQEFEWQRNQIEAHRKKKEAAKA